ncbi:hypothetical protein A2U01_0079083 [Trifolium medium]|uniref:Uncharacterized protein n=1 Tax=Trifolium medium TaxID=97028 RepID=A0A392TAC1_9FABA|nr:hypothetical protein [Trifolium medium]
MEATPKPLKTSRSAPKLRPARRGRKRNWIYHHQNRRHLPSKKQWCGGGLPELQEEQNRGRTQRRKTTSAGQEEGH